MRWSVLALAGLMVVVGAPGVMAGQTPSAPGLGMCEYLEPTDAPDVPPVWLSDYGVTVTDGGDGGTGVLKCFFDPWGFLADALDLPEPPCDVGDTHVAMATTPGVVVCGIDTAPIVDYVVGAPGRIQPPTVDCLAPRASAFSCDLQPIQLA